MIGVLKIIILLMLPFLFILPWILVKNSYQETPLWDVLAGQPLLTTALLLPGVILIAMYLLKLRKRAR